ncbi:MAG TPA: cation diffusion facilitator family transporter [Candidatus Limiplasma sp.]|nr:cation diffusion facilitator family transporter [Candidatus Limiplasma sp.]
MTHWLIHRFIHNPDDVTNRKVRAAYGTLGSVTGIILNILLSGLKFLVGVLSGSLAATADAVNNLSDAAGSLMSLITMRMAVKPNDKTHPFGHGRMEYIGALAVGALIVVAGVRLLSDGIRTVFHPEAMSVSIVMLCVLIAAILVKLWLYFYYRKLARLINSETLFAASKDSLSDTAATSAVVVSMVLEWLFGWQIDGYMGILVALFVLKAGYDVCKETIDRLLGGKPDPQLIRDIKNILLRHKEIHGLHDLIVHDYGPGRCIASVHAEVDASDDIVAIHEIIDQAERELKDELGMEVCIHMDPTVTNDPKINALRDKMLQYLQSIDMRLSLHDFRIVPGEHQINLVFDCLLPDDEIDTDQLLAKLRAYAKQLDSRYELVVQFDTDFS